jgi:hypothetical protein
VSLEVGLEYVDLILRELERLNQLVELREIDAAALLAASDQRRHLWT